MGVEFKEIEHIGDIIVSEKESDWVTSLRLMEAITDKGTNQYFDLRKMKKTNKETIFGKGITMSMEELKELSNLLNVFFNDKGGNV